MAFLGLYISKFSGRACPQTPLAALCLRLRLLISYARQLEILVTALQSKYDARNFKRPVHVNSNLQKISAIEINIVPDTKVETAKRRRNSKAAFNSNFTAISNQSPVQTSSDPSPRFHGALISIQGGGRRVPRLCMCEHKTRQLKFPWIVVTVICALLTTP